MSKCCYCNNELTTGDNPKHFGICNKCYDEMFKSGNTIIRSLTNKITDLEAKLALTEKALELACKELRDDSCMRCNSCNRLEMCDYVLSLYPTSYFIEEAKESLK